MKEIIICNEKHAIIKQVFQIVGWTFFIGVFAWTGWKEAAPLLIELLLVLITLIFPAFFVWMWMHYMRYPYLFKADEKGLSTFLLTNQELLIPWETISSIKTFKTMQVVKSIRRRGPILPYRTVTRVNYQTTLEIAIWDRDFLAAYENQATSLLKQSIKSHPVRENDPKRWTVKIPCVLLLVETDLGPKVEQMEQLRNLQK